MGDRKQPSPAPGRPGYAGPPQQRPAPPPQPPPERARVQFSHHGQPGRARRTDDLRAAVHAAFLAGVRHGFGCTQEGFNSECAVARVYALDGAGLVDPEQTVLWPDAVSAATAYALTAFPEQ